jgi:hypothetical protein
MWKNNTAFFNGVSSDAGARGNRLPLTRGFWNKYIEVIAAGAGRLWTAKSQGEVTSSGAVS